MEVKLHRIAYGYGARGGGVKEEDGGSSLGIPFYHQSGCNLLAANPP